MLFLVKTDFWGSISLRTERFVSRVKNVIETEYYASWLPRLFRSLSSFHHSTDLGSLSPRTTYHQIPWSLAPEMSSGCRRLLPARPLALLSRRAGSGSGPFQTTAPDAGLSPATAALAQIWQLVLQTKEWWASPCNHSACPSLGFILHSLH